MNGPQPGDECREEEESMKWELLAQRLERAHLTEAQKGGHHGGSVVK